MANIRHMQRTILVLLSTIAFVFVSFQAQAVEWFEFSLQGTVYDKTTGQPVFKAKVELLGSDEFYTYVMTDRNGAFDFTRCDAGRCIQEKTSYSIRCSRDGYLFVYDGITTVGVSESVNFKKEYYIMPGIPEVKAETIDLKYENGVFLVPCRVNGINLKFVFDTGASDVSISATEALFMLKNGYLNETDFGDKQYYMDASGNINEGTVVTLRRIDFGPVTLRNVRASVVHSLVAPLLLGQSALGQIGPITFDSKKGTLTVVGNRWE